MPLVAPVAVAAVPIGVAASNVRFAPREVLGYNASVTLADDKHVDQEGKL